jgi:hypothetical protein
MLLETVSTIPKPPLLPAPAYTTIMDRNQVAPRKLSPITFCIAIMVNGIRQFDVSL